MAESENNTASTRLTERIRKTFSGSERRGIMVERSPRHKGLVIAFCGLAACFLWFTFSVRETFTQVFEFSTAIQNLPPELALTSLPPASVLVQLEGEGIQLLRLYYNPPTVPIDASADQVDLSLIMPELASNVSTTTVMPQIVNLEKEPREIKRVPIRSQVRILPVSGFHVVGRVRFDPDSVTVSGAESIINRLDFWPTEDRILSAVSDTVRLMISLSDTLEGLVDLDLTQTLLTADVPDFTEGNRAIEIRARDVPADQQITFDPTTTNAVYQIPIAQFDLALDAEDFYAFVRYSDILADTTGRVYPLINLPAGIEMRSVRLSPESMRYYFVGGN